MKRIIGVLIIILTILLAIILFYITDLTMLSANNNNSGDNTIIDDTNSIKNDDNNTTVNNEATSNTTNDIVNNTITNSTQNNVANNATSNSTQNDTITANSSAMNNVIGEKDTNETDIYFAEPNYSIEINGITDDISKHIKDQDEFNKELTKYVFDNGLSNANSMEVQKYEYQESTDRLAIIFILDNSARNRLRVIINSNGNIDISNYD